MKGGSPATMVKPAAVKQAFGFIRIIKQALPGDAYLPCREYRIKVAETQNLKRSYFSGHQDQFIHSATTIC